MQEYMLHIRNQGEHVSTLSPEKHEQFLKACEDYISNLKKNGNLIAAQPIAREGVMLSGTPGNWKTGPYNENKEVQVGYYHIRAHNLDEAVELAKGNPEFAYTDTARVEVRPLKTKEASTGFEYPTEG